MVMKGHYVLQLPIVFPGPKGSLWQKKIARQKDGKKKKKKQKHPEDGSYHIYLSPPPLRAETILPLQDV